MEGLIPKNVTIASKILVLEPKEIFDPKSKILGQRILSEKIMLAPKNLAFKTLGSKNILGYNKTLSQKKMLGQK